MDAILLLGHGSRLTETNKTLRQMACMVREIGNIPLVEIAFLQFGRPDFFEGVSACVSKGAKKIIIYPYFLYRGRHFEEDITEMIGDAQKKYTDVEFVLTEPLGVHENIAKVVLERIKKDIKGVRIIKPYQIEERSFEIISDELGKTNFRDIELPIVKRVIHATGDFDFAKNMRFHPEAVEAGIKAIKDGMNILVDVEMVKAGINKNLLAQWGVKVICGMRKAEDREQRTEDRGQIGNTFRYSVLEKNPKSEIRDPNKTEAEIGIELAAKKNNNIGIVTIGNAPTALYKLMKLMRDTDFNPKLVIGVPVGFVKAVESKEVLLHMKYPFITSLGRKGGSSVAVAIVNALLKMAEGEVKK